MTRIHKRGFDPIPYPSLLEDVAQMGLDGLGALKKLIGDFFIPAGANEQKLMVWGK